MKRIQRVIIDNFQNHDHTDIELDSGINLITGSSDAGKSAILRAISWALHNKPARANFVSNGATEASVRLEFTDGHNITRVKGADNNSVIWEEPDGTSHKFERIGHVLPIEVEAAMGFPPHDESHGPISYSDQLNNLYLVSLSPTDLPRSLSELTGISDFEEAIQDLSRQKRDSEKEINTIQRHIDELEVQIKEYDDLPRQIEIVEANGKIIQEIQEINDSLVEIRRLSSQYEKIKIYANNIIAKNKIINKKIAHKRDAEKLREICGILNAANTIQDGHEIVMEKVAECERKDLRIQERIEHEKMAEKVRSLWTLLNNINKISEEHSVVTKRIANQDREVTQKTRRASAEVVEKAKNTRGLMVNLQNAKTLLGQSDEVLQSGKAVRQKVNQFKARYTELLEQKEIIVTELKKTDEWCAICDAPKRYGVN